MMRNTSTLAMDRIKAALSFLRQNKQERNAAQRKEREHIQSKANRNKEGGRNREYSSIRRQRYDIRAVHIIMVTLKKYQETYFVAGVYNCGQSVQVREGGSCATKFVMSHISTGR